MDTTTETQSQTVTPAQDLGYGFKKNGEPKQAPGRKPSATTTKQFYVIDGVPIAGKGRPSPEQYAKRRLVVMPKHETYDSSIHGFGERQPEDDLMVQIIQAREAKKPAKKPVEAPMENHVTEITVSNSPVITNMTIGETDANPEMVAV